MYVLLWIFIYIYIYIWQPKCLSFWRFSNRIQLEQILQRKSTLSPSPPPITCGSPRSLEAKAWWSAKCWKNRVRSENPTILMVYLFWYTNQTYLVFSVSPRVQHNQQKVKHHGSRVILPWDVTWVPKNGRIWKTISCAMTSTQIVFSIAYTLHTEK